MTPDCKIVLAASRIVGLEGLVTAILTGGAMSE